MNQKKRYDHGGRTSNQVVVHECDLHLEEPVDFDSITFKWITRLVSLSGLIRYLKPFKTAPVCVEEVYQFYDSLFYDRSQECTKLQAMINKTLFVVREIEVSDIIFLPCTSMRIKSCDHFKDLPLMFTKEDF